VWIVGAVALVAFLVLRRRRLEPPLLVGGAIAAIGMAVYGSGVVELPNLEETLLDVGKTLGNWTYLLVGVMAFLETGAFVGLLAPGETVMLLGGLVAGQGQIDVLTLIGIVWACAVAGDVTSLFLGRRLGRAFLVKHGPKFQITEPRLEQVERFFDRHGGKAILIGRFVGIVRAMAPFLAGSSGMTLRRFLPYDVIGAGLWSSTFILLGYIFWQSFDRLVGYAEKGALALGTLITVVVGLLWAVRWMRVPGHREQAMAWLDRQAERPLPRPVVRALRPVVRLLSRPARFLFNRVTPGELGLEVTTLLAVLSVGVYAFVSTCVKAVDGGLSVLDDDAFDLADDADAGMLVDVAKSFTELGALPVVIVLVVLVTLLLAWRRELVEGLFLLAGVGLTYAAVHIVKNAVDRPRPPGALIATDGSSYPSGHAAYAVAWVACAIVVTRVLPTLGARFALVTVSIVVAAGVALSRVYLRAHWLSDVAAGAGLAASIFAVLGIVALVVDHLRHNARAPA